MVYFKEVDSNGCYGGELEVEPVVAVNNNNNHITMTDKQMEALANHLDALVLGEGDLLATRIIDLSHTTKKEDEIVKRNKAEIESQKTLSCSATHVFIHDKNLIGRGHWKSAFEGQAIEFTTGALINIIRLKAEIIREAGLHECSTHKRFSSHPNVVTLYGYRTYEKPGIPNNSGMRPAAIDKIQMYVEKCDRTLEQAIRDPSFIFEQKIHTMSGIASAIGYIQQDGYNHSDIKPDNIMLKNNEGKLTDFGSCNQTTMKTVMNHSLAPPEQKNRILRASNEADVYQFGLTLWHVFHPNPDHIDESLGEARFDLSSPDTLFEGWPETTKSEKAILNLTKACLDPNPNNRPCIKEVEKTLNTIKAHP